MTGKISPLIRCQKHRPGRRVARRAMLALSLMAFSPDAVVPNDHGQINWGGKVYAAEGGDAAFEDVDVFADLAPLEDDALEEQRGGFSLAGLEIDVGVSVATTIEGFVEISTNYSLTTDKGLVQLGREIKNLTLDMTAGIESEAKEAMADSTSVNSDLSFPSETSFTITNTTADAPETLAAIIHQAEGEHVTLLTNRLNNVSIQHTVSLNITLENLSRITAAARLQNDFSLMTREISLFSLRH